MYRTLDVRVQFEHTLFLSHGNEITLYMLLHTFHAYTAVATEYDSTIDNKLYFADLRYK